MEVNPISQANLNQGYVDAGRKFAGRDRIVAVIAETLAPDFADDDAVRFHLGKVWDFEVTPEVRAAVVAEKALQVFNAIFNNIKKQVIIGDDVSINGFATFRRVNAPDGWPVGVAPGSGEMRVIKQADKILSEYRTASETPGSWQGGALQEEYFVVKVAAGSTVSNELTFKTGAQLGIFSSVTVTGTTSDGVARSYEIGGKNIKVFGRLSVRPEAVGDWSLIFTPELDQAARFAADRAARGWTAQYVLENLGSIAVPMGVQEWGQVQAMVWNDRLRAWAADEYFYTMPVHLILECFPKRARVFRDQYGALFEVKLVTPAVFRANFGYAETYLRSVGDWPEPVRNLLDTVKAEFRPDFIAALQDGTS